MNQVIFFLLILNFLILILKSQTSIKGNTYNTGAGKAVYDTNKVGKNETEVVIPLKHLGNFWKTLNIPLINCETELILIWSKNCVLSDMTAANNPPTGLESQITGTKLYVPVITLSKKTPTKWLLEEDLKEL